jgi:hypothetical protein
MSREGGKVTKRIRKTTDDEMLKRVERVEIYSPCEADALPTSTQLGTQVNCL